MRSRKKIEKESRKVSDVEFSLILEALLDLRDLTAFIVAQTQGLGRFEQWLEETKE